MHHKSHAVLMNAALVKKYRSNIRNKLHCELNVMFSTLDTAFKKC